MAQGSAKFRSEARWRGALAVFGLVVGLVLITNDIPFGFLFIAGAIWQGYMTAQIRSAMMKRELNDG